MQVNVLHYKGKTYKIIPQTMSAKRILVVDNEEYIREVAQICLETVAGWHVLTASSGQEGLASAETEQPDAILLDVMMPDMDGVTTFQRLQENSATRHIPVILLTAKVQASDRRRYDNLGITGLIPKPFDPLQLAHQVATALGWDSL
jgi:CheY-like chemotaxis protein